MVDVDGMLESMTPQQMDEWIAYYRIEPFGDEWLQAGTIAAVMYNVVASVGAAMGGKSLKDKDMRDPDDFIPSDKPKRRRRATTPAEQMAVIASTMGM